MKNLTTIGRTFIAVAMIVFGVQQCVYLDFVTRVFPRLPTWIPGQALIACVLGAFLIIAGIAILVGYDARSAALLLGGVILLSVVVLYLPRLFANLQNPGAWTNPGKALALAGASFLVAGTLTAVTTGGWRATIDKAFARFIPLGRCFLAAFLILAGVLHFVYAPFVARLVPAWIPGHLFWTWFSGCALIAGGIGIVVPWTTRLAAYLVGVMILLWVLLLHIPRALANLHDSNETTAVFEALAFSGMAFLIAVNPKGKKKTSG